MRVTKSLALLFPALSLGIALTAAAESRKVIRLSGDFSFLSDAPLEKIQGTAEGATAIVYTDLDDLTRTTGTVVVPVASLKTGNSIRDDHLKSSNWLDAATYPEIKFTISAVTGVKSEQRGAVLVTTGLVKGIFTLHGVSKELETPVTVKWKGDRVKASISFTVRLGDHALRGNKGIVGSKVGETIEIKGILTGRAKDAQ
jgi:polyisoprenoid-binding protein YceI